MQLVVGGEMSSSVPFLKLKKKTDCVHLWINALQFYASLGVETPKFSLRGLSLVCC